MKTPADRHDDSVLDVVRLGHKREWGASLIRSLHPNRPAKRAARDA